jgi:cytochrome P450
MTDDLEVRADGRINCPFDHHAPDYGENFRRILNDLRDVAPIVWTESYGGFWIATAYATVRRIAIDSETFTVAPGPDRTGGLRIPAPPGLKIRPLFVPGETDGEEHDRYRLALNPHFSKARVAEMMPMINARVAQVIDRVIELDEFDVVGDLIVPILSGVACEHLGIDVEDPPTMFRDLHRMVSMTPSSPEEFDRIRASFESSWGRLVEIVEARRAEPRNDVISHLVEHPESFTDEEVEMMTLNVILGALHTTSSLLAQIIIHLDLDPELRKRLRDHPDLIPAAIEEFLRLKAVTITLARTATRDVDIDGVSIKKGDRILMSFAAANHDPAKYPHPESFDLRRGAAQHLGLGVGSHFCLGAWLAKAMAASVVRQLLDRTDRIAVDHQRIVVSPEVSNAYSLEQVPARAVVTAK